MRVLSRTENARGIAERWFKVYNRNGNWHYGEDKRTIYENLKALGKGPDPDLVDIAIGNDSWTRCSCDECGDAFEEVVQVGQEPDYESATASLCFDCVLKALVIVHENRSQ